MNLKVYEIAYDETLTVDGTVAAQIVSYDVVFSDQGPQGIQGIQGIQGPTGTSALTNQGDILYRNATVPDRLPIGTAGQFLKVNTGATAPEWATITKSTVGLGNVDNTSDSNKPVSTATQAALDLKANLASPTFTGTVSGITKSMVGLGNVDNTSDANKPISSATQTALDGKASSAAAVPSGGTTGQVLRKKTNSNYDTEWGDESGGGGGVPTSRTISAGTGLTGGGDLSANRTLAVSYGTTAGTACQGNDGRIAGIESGSITTGIDNSAIQPQQIKVGFAYGPSLGGFIDLRGSDEAGGSIDLSNKGTGGLCASIAMHDGGGNDAGYLNTSGGIIGNGGSIDTSDGGGSISTTQNGGSINTSNGGGSIDTRGTGSIEFGIAGTRTTLTGTATANRAISLPNAAGTLALTSDITKSAVGLGNVTNNAQTQAAIVPNTAPSAGQLLVGNAGGTAYAPATLSGDATIASTGALTLANTSTARTNIGLGNVPNVDTTNAANISSGILPNARVNWAAPSAIGSTTAAAATVTDLKADTLTMPKSGQPTILANFTSGNLTATGQIRGATITTETGGTIIVNSAGSLRFDAGSTIIDPVDSTKKAALDLSGITAGQTRTLTVPNATGTLALTSDITKSAVGLGNVTNNAQVTSVSGTAPIVSSGGTTPTISVTTGTTAGTVAAGDHTHSQLHDRSHAITSTSDHTATANRVFYSNNSGQVTELALGAANTVLTSNGTTSAPSFAAVSAGATNLWIPASSWIPRTTTGCGVDSTELSTNKVNTDQLLFDAATEEYAQALVMMPSNYNYGTITARFYWTASSGSGGVAFGLRGRAYADDDALDQAQGTGQVTTDTFIVANDLHVTAATSAITLAGTPAANRPVQYEIYRQVSNASDTLGVDARLLGVEVIFN